jgi:hypothetical protein
MKANVASLINAIILISMGTWGYLDSESKAVTALIPVVIGVVLLLVNKGVQKENKVIAHVAVLLTLLILIGLIKPLMGSFERGNVTAIIRVLLMIISTAWALKAFIQSFIDARKARESSK